MKTKLFEVRDRATCLVVMATKMQAETHRLDDDELDYDKYEREVKLLSRGGFRNNDSKPLIMMTELNGGRTNYIPEAWNDRTFQTVHRYIRDSFDELEQDDVLDVEYILGEKNTIKRTEI